jgi:hypothetical protein
MRRLLLALAVLAASALGARAQMIYGTGFQTGALGAAGATSLAVNGALPAAAANTLILGGVSSNPTFAANGEGGIWLLAGGGLVMGGQGSTNDWNMVNRSAVSVLRNPTGTTNVVGAGTLTGMTGLTSSGTITFSGVTTGTNTNFACFAAGGVMTLQSSACTISSMRFKDFLYEQANNDSLHDVLKLQPIVFAMKTSVDVANPDRNYYSPQIGLSAENVAAVNPKCAIYEQDGKTPKSYRQECLIAELVGAVRELKADNDSLRAEIRRRD